MLKHQAFNPYLPSFEYVPDGEPYVFGERIYVYGSHDSFNGTEFCVNNYVCWSAPVSQLSDWKYEGIIYKKEQDPFIPDPKNRRMFAPDMTKGPDGRYYFYYAFDFTGTIAVAVCDTPAGEFTYYGRVHYTDGTFLGAREDDVFHYDPGVLTDDDGRVFLYSGFCPMGEFRKRFSHLPKGISDGGMVIELEADMLTVKTAPKVVIPNPDFAQESSFKGHAFFEAPSMRKVNGKYYYIYSSEKQHELCYAISDYPDHDFVYGGIIISNGDIGFQGRKEPLNYTGTNHGSIECILGQWYVFYHRQTNGNPYSRQGCADKITILEDGSIPQIEMTSCGLNDGPLLGEGWYNAGIACCLMSGHGAAPYAAKTQISEEHPYFTQTGEDREENPDQYITNLRDGAIAGYKYFELQGPGTVTVRTKGRGIGCLQLLYTLQGEVQAEFQLQPSDEWQEVTAQADLPKGVSALWFRYRGEGCIDFQGFKL